MTTLPTSPPHRHLVGVWNPSYGAGTGEMQVNMLARAVAT